MPSVYRRSISWLNRAFDAGVVRFKNVVPRNDTRNRLVILDDIFPHRLSSFRIAEYNSYLDAFPDTQIYSTATAFPLVGEKRQFVQVVKEFEDHYPQYRGKVFKYTSRQDLSSGLIYTIFLNNALRFVTEAERYGSPFVFTLYPGGGFRLEDNHSDNSLRRVFSSPSFRKVIVTQKISYDYIITHGLCLPEQIEFIYGGVLPSQLLINSMREKKCFRDTKSTFDICFVANKYTERGVDKGYDIFIEVAKNLSRTCKEMVFHVVGPFNSSDIDVSHIEDKIHFHGWIHTDSFPDFYSHMDIIISPNRHFALNPGSFDGFPTGACIEAGICGVAVFCTDSLNQNLLFKDREEIVIIPHDPDRICALVEMYFHRYSELFTLSLRGRRAFRRIFDLKGQVTPRIRILRECMNS